MKHLTKVLRILAGEHWNAGAGAETERTQNTDSSAEGLELTLLKRATQTSVMFMRHVVKVDQTRTAFLSIYRET